MNGDISLFKPGVFGILGSVTHQVAAQATTPLINPYEPVGKTLGTNTQYVISLATSGPTTSVTVLGISVNASNETSTTDGTVDVIPAIPGTIWSVAPTTAATWNTQASYNALVGSRTLLAKSASNNTGIYTMGASDSSTNGCIIENLNIQAYPGQVAFSFRGAAMFYVV